MTELDKAAARLRGRMRVHLEDCREVVFRHEYAAGSLVVTPSGELGLRRRLIRRALEEAARLHEERALFYAHARDKANEGGNASDARRLNAEHAEAGLAAATDRALAAKLRETDDE